MNTNSKREVETAPTVERAGQSLPPPVNIYETEEGYLLEADLPGVSKDGLEVFLNQTELTLVGHRAEPTHDVTHYRETRPGDFRRVFELDPEIDTSKITARVESGVLSLHLAKRERVKPRRIAVTD